MVGVAVGALVSALPGAWSMEDHGRPGHAVSLPAAQDPWIPSPPPLRHPILFALCITFAICITEWRTLTIISAAARGSGLNTVPAVVVCLRRVWRPLI
jgi:hypothetical protein